MMVHKYFLWVTLFSVAVSVGGCQAPATVEQQSAALTVSAPTLAQRQLQSRRFETRDEAKLLSACAGVLQDLGFTIDESSVSTGLIVASKDRSAIEAGEVAGQVIIAALITALGGHADPTWDKDQKIRISIVTRPLSSKSTLVRVTFQRVVRNTKDQITKAETINDPIIYQQFFDKLKQSVFLEAHQI